MPWSRVQNFPHLLLERLDRERFHEDRHMRVQPNVLQHDLLTGEMGDREGRHIQDPHPRAKQPELPPQRSAVHTWHDQIGKEKIDSVRLLVGDLQSLTYVLSHEDLI